MAQWIKTNQAFSLNSNTVFETVLLASGDGNIVSNTNPLPVTIDPQHATMGID